MVQQHRHDDDVDAIVIVIVIMILTTLFLIWDRIVSTYHTTVLYVHQQRIIIAAAQIVSYRNVSILIAYPDLYFEYSYVTL
mmetsp:Transcript_18427/g.20642  ORF Transcript_18427/g.20642 Transcript_18427/m.20642 type:complete len:81 (-) Transcript_18427:735-977(-)